jgi:hypothetical protein
MANEIIVSEYDKKQIAIAIKVIEQVLETLSNENENYIHETDTLFYAKDILNKIEKGEPLI